MNKTNIDWPWKPLYTWNPITGCNRGCSYCYARRIHERFNKIPFSEIQYHPNRMDDLEWLGRQKKSLTIFVGSMSDIEYWPKEITDNILYEVGRYHRHTFMFLSKNFLSYYGFNWPKNTMQGLTLTKTDGFIKELDFDSMPRPFISLEPLLGEVKYISPNFVEKVIVGAMTGPGAIIPRPEWMQSVIDHVPPEKIYWKNNIKKYLPKGIL
jgi:protein gp37